MPGRPRSVQRTVCVRRALIELAAAQHGDGLAHLPVAVLGQAIERRFDLGPVEGAECGHRTAAQCGLAGGGREDQGEPSWITELGYAGNRLFEHQCILGAGAKFDDVLEETVFLALADGAERVDHHEPIRITQCGAERLESLNFVEFVGDLRREPGGRPADMRVGVGQSSGVHARLQATRTGEPAERRGSKGGVRALETFVQRLGPHGRGVGCCGQERLAPRNGVCGRYRVVLVTHDSSIASPPGDSDLPRRPSASRGRRIAQWVLGICVVLALGVIILSRLSAGEYAITPGGAQDVAPLITIDGHAAPKNQGSVMLTDVSLTPVTWLNWPWFHLVSSNASFVPESALVPAGIPASQLNAQGYLEMAQSKNSAKAAALTRLGYKVTATHDGALITAVSANAPARDAVSVADVVDQVNGVDVHTSCELIAAVHDLDPGTQVELGVRKATISRDGTITRSETKAVAVTLGTPPKPVDSHCPGVTGPSKSYLGVGLQDDVSYIFPMEISISTPNIGGPSAGLAMTLGIIDRLSGGHLVQGHHLAATGTIDPEGHVGDVGGVAQKTVAVTRAGATTFFVPHEELSVARGKAPSSLKVVAVGTLDEAINQLLRQGGTLTMADGTVESRASAGLAP